ncbi:MAG TPA: thioester reductase domain-containing protein [Longimicrobiaceae bacterium]|nr:thioester reductase domain-containing protein [Longimicrobiaceae bacterium]
MSSRAGEPGYEDAVAVIAMSGCFPGAATVEEFWRNLRAGVESVAFFSVEEMEEAGSDPGINHLPTYVPAHGVLDGVERFDAAFFGFSPREAETMDPQVRLFLETAWEALERAGYDAERHDGAIGVFAGATMNHYLMHAVQSDPSLMARAGGLQSGILNHNFIATWTSYKLGLRGPSVNLQTACSTSLVAIHLAVQSLLAGECSMALAGGASIQVPQKRGYLWEEGGILSPDGHCRAFDASAAGTVDGSGVGVVVLKRMEEALEDGDVIHAVIRASAVNNDGSLKAGFTAPSVGGQAAVIAEALALARVDPETIGYVECHGTATPLGDPIEVAALTQAYRARTPGTGFCALGGVKTNIGHLDVAAGVAGFIKAAQSLKHGEIAPSLHFRAPNPEIDFASSPFFVNAELRPWKTDGHPRRAGVSSFGIGGTNAHVILEEAPRPEPAAPGRPVQVLTLSARTETALERATANLADWLSAHPDASLADVAFTLQVGRRAFRHRRIALATDTADAVAALRDRPLTLSGEPGSRPVAFVFPGTVDLPLTAVGELYHGEPAFREAVDGCAEVLRPGLGTDLREMLSPGTYPGDWGITVSQCALVAVEYALARLWAAWGLRPEAVLGEGAGEIAAAAVAGVLSLEDALAFALARGRLLEARARGTPPDAEMRALAQQIRVQKTAAPSLPLLSAATGGPVGAETARDPRHWLALLAEPARMDGALRALVAGTGRILVEVGSAGGLAARAAAATGDAERPVLPSLPEVEAPGAADELLAGALGFLWVAGVRVDWDAYHAGWGRRRVELPTYPFERQFYWLGRKRAAGAARPAQVAAAPAAPAEPAHDRPRLQVEYVAPRTELEERIAEGWRGIFGIREVGVFDSFYDLGGTSLMAPRLILLLRERLGTEVPLNALYQAPTIADLAEMLGTPSAEAGAAPAAAAKAADLRAEVTLDPEISPRGPVREGAPRAVLLTGATGFLGSYLLHELLARTGARVHCLVRAPDAAEGMERIRRKLDSYGLWDERHRGRIVPVPGDLARPLLGLGSDAFSALAEGVDAIYHNGAQVNHTFPYAALRAANVGGTQEVLRLACTGAAKPVHFLSSIAVYAPPPPGEPVPEVLREDDPVDEWRTLTGYAQSKWVAEHVVRLAAGRGLPVAIYRPGIVTGDSRSGICSTHDFIWRMTRACVEMGSVPDMNGGTDVAPIDYVSAAIVALSLRPDSAGRAFNLTHPDGVRWNDLWESARRYGYRLDPVHRVRWVGEMLAEAEASEEHPLRQFMAMFAGERPEGEEEDLEIPAPRFDCANVLRGLEGTGVACPAVDDRLLHRYFDYFVEIGFLPAPADGEAAWSSPGSAGAEAVVPAS